MATPRSFRLLLVLTPTDKTILILYHIQYSFAIANTYCLPEWEESSLNERHPAELVWDETWGRG